MMERDAAAVTRTLCGDRNDMTRPALASVAASYQKWLSFGRMLATTNAFEDPWQPVTETVHRMTEKGPGFALLMPGCANGRRPCVTETRYIGCVPPLAMVGDIVYLVQGAQVPFVLRDVKGEGADVGRFGAERYQLVGEAYVHGVMDGELFGRETGELRMEDLEII
jgi:hypothetical protein